MDKDNNQPHEDTTLPTEPATAPPLPSPSNDDADTKPGAPAAVLSSQPETKPVSVAPAATETADAPESVPLPANPDAPVLQPAAVPWHKRPVFWIIIVAVLVAAGIASYIALRPSDEPAATVQRSSEKPAIKRLGAVLSVADGVVEAGADGQKWQPIKAGDSLRPGTFIRTAAGGRAVVTLDDGSAIRVAAASIARLASLNADDVIIVNQSGEVYTRVVASERKFSVVVDEEAYMALGTAYKTTNTAQTKGVEVYHSQVKADEAGETVPEGKRYFQKNASAELTDKQSDIPLDALQKDTFLQWNLEQDKQSGEFKDKLGYLEKLAAAPKPVAAPAPAAKPGVGSGISLAGSKTDSGVLLGWKLTGVSAPKGFKILRSTSANPVYGKSEAAYVESASARSYTWKIKDGKTYHFRVCVYTGDGCTDYSNNISVAAPLMSEAKPAGSINLTHSENPEKLVNWSISGGSALYGYKLVWSANASPTYGEADASAAFYDGSATAGKVTSSGKTYVRVCMYFDGQCLNYSNEISPTF